MVWQSVYGTRKLYITLDLENLRDNKKRFMYQVSSSENPYEWNIRVFGNEK